VAKTDWLGRILCMIIGDHAPTWAMCPTGFRCRRCGRELKGP
jgi:hypothetical protein